MVAMVVSVARLLPDSDRGNPKPKAREPSDDSIETVESLSKSSAPEHSGQSSDTPAESGAEKTGYYDRAISSEPQRSSGAASSEPQPFYYDNHFKPIDIQRRP